MYNCKKCSRFLPLYSIRNTCICHISFKMILYLKITMSNLLLYFTTQKCFVFVFLLQNRSMVHHSRGRGVFKNIYKVRYIIVVCIVSVCGLRTCAKLIISSQEQKMVIQSIYWTKSNFISLPCKSLLSQRDGTLYISC